MHRDSLGLLDCLLHVVMLLFSCVSREDGELVNLNAVYERKPVTYAKALVCLAIHANPWILCVHLVNNPIPLHLRLANNEATEQLVCLLGLFDIKVFLGLGNFLEFVKLLFFILLSQLRSCCQGN